MAGFDNEVVYGINADFSGASTPDVANGLALDKQVWMGTTALNAGGTHVNVVNLVDSATIAIVQSGTNLSFTATGQASDVIGPASSTDNALVRFDGTTGKLIQNGVITEDDTGNLSITAAVSGATLSSTLSNTSNTASAQAKQQVTVGGGSAGDPFTTYTIAGGTSWSQGIDNSATGDPYILAASTALGTTNVISANTNGSINYPLQPCFQGVLQTTDTDFGGDGSSVFYIGSGNALTEIFDYGNNFDTNGTFTAPVTGVYRFGASFDLSGLLVTHTLVALSFQVNGTSYAYNYSQSAPFTLLGSNGRYVISGSAMILLTSGQTCKAGVFISGGTKTVDLFANSNTSAFSWFEGHLIA